MEKLLRWVNTRAIETMQAKITKISFLFVQEHVNAILNDTKKGAKSLQSKELPTREESTTSARRFSDLLYSKRNMWFWFTIGLTIISLITILFIPESGTPLSYIRYAFAFILAEFLPGYCLIEALFPKKNSMDYIEKFTFSVGLSFAITALVALFLSLSPLGFTLATALVTLDGIIILLALIGLKRKFAAYEQRSSKS